MSDFCGKHSFFGGEKRVGWGFFSMGRAGVGVDKDMRLGPGNLDNYLGFLIFVCIETCDTLDLQRNFSPHSVKLGSSPHYA